MCVCVCVVFFIIFVITFNRFNEDFDISIELLGGAVGGVGGAVGGMGVSPDSSNPIRIQQIARISSSDSDGGPASPSRGGGN